MKIDTELIKDIIKKTSFTLIILGIILIIFAAIKNIGEYSIIDTNWRIFIAGIGTLLLFIGLILTLKENSSSKNQNIRISKPLDEEKIKGSEEIIRVDISGTYKKEINNCYLFVQKSGDVNVYSQSKINWIRDNNTWEGHVWLGGKPEKKYHVFFAKVGINGQKQINKYELGRKSKKWTPFVPDRDIEKLDRIIVYKTNK